MPRCTPPWPPRYGPPPRAPRRSPPRMSEPTGAQVTVGDLLVATPMLLDPNFERSVVLVLDADDDGALGVVLNRPSQVPVEEILPDWGALAGSPDVLFQGGPVSTDSALAVGGAPPPPPAGRGASRSASGGCTTGWGSSTSTRRPRSSVPP